MHDDTIFTKIIKGDIPSHKIYEDEKTFAFLDIFPIQEGMTLVVPKVQVASIEDLEDEDYQALWRSVKLIAKKMRETYPDKAKIGIQVEGLDVPHVHVKMFPINSGDEFRAKPNREVEPDHDALAAVARKLAINI